MAKAKCAKCGKELVHISWALTMGGRGFRQYPVCESCKAKIEKASQKPVKVPDAARIPEGG